jgi:hypothetical protein
MVDLIVWKQHRLMRSRATESPVSLRDTTPAVNGTVTGPSNYGSSKRSDRLGTDRSFHGYPIVSFFYVRERAFARFSRDSGRNIPTVNWSK